MNISIYKTAKDNQGVCVSVDAVIKRIKSGARGLHEKTRMCRVLAETDPEAYRDYKTQLPAVAWSGHFRERKASELIAHSGLVVLDFDDIDVAGLMADLSLDPHVFFAFVSPSGAGAKVVVPVSPVPTDAAEHKAAFEDVKEHFEEYGEIDVSGRDVSRLCFLAHDPRLIYHHDAVPVSWDPSDVPETQQASDGEGWAGGSRAMPAVEGKITLDVAKEVLAYVPKDISYEDWRNVGMGIKAAGLPVSVWSDWCEGKRLNSSGVWITEDPLSHWGRYNSSGITWGTVVHLAKQNGYEPPVTSRSLHVDTDFQRETSTLEAERASVYRGLQHWLDETDGETHQILNITTAAGTGKSTASIITAENLLYIAKTTEEADQAFLLSTEKEKDAWRHRPRMFNREMENWETLPVGLGALQRPCIQPELCNAVAAAGHSPQVICDRCPARSICTESGYLAQEQIERNKQQVFYAWDEAFFSDRVHRERVKRLIDGSKLLVCDEALPSRLPMQRRLSLSELAHLAELWRFPEQMDLYDFLSHLTGELAKAVTAADFYKAISPVDQLTAEKLNEWDALLGTLPLACVLEGDGLASVEWEGTAKQVDALQVFDSQTPVEKYRLYWQYVSLFKIQELGLFDKNAIPRVYPSVFRDLQTFRETSRAETPACHREKDEWFYYIPPGLNADRGVVLSASDTADHVRAVYDGTGYTVTTLTGKPPSWKEGCQLYQIRTGRYTLRQGLLTGEGALRSQASRMVELVRVTSETGKKCLVVAQKAFLESEGLQGLRSHPNVTLINHHHAEGRNDYQDHDIVFVFHFEPSPEVIQSQTCRIFRDTSDLSFDREPIEIKKDGACITRERYRDQRVQQVFDRECEARLMQSVLRLRQHLNENKIAVLFTAEPVGGFPVAPVLFSLKDAERCLGEAGNWDALQEIVSLRDDGDVDAVQAVTGKSERQAYRDTAEARKKSKAERDAEILLRILELKAQHPELGERKFAKELGISYGKLRSLLKNAGVH